MKSIKYQILQSLSADGIPITLEKTIPYSEAYEKIAKEEAYNGEYTIVDGGLIEAEAETESEASTGAYPAGCAAYSE